MDQSKSIKEKVISRASNKILLKTIGGLLTIARNKSDALRPTHCSHLPSNF